MATAELSQGMLHSLSCIGLPDITLQRVAAICLWYVCTRDRWEPHILVWWGSQSPFAARCCHLFLTVSSGGEFCMHSVSCIYSCFLDGGTSWKSRWNSSTDAQPLSLFTAGCTCRVQGDTPTPVASLGRLPPCTWNLLKLYLASSQSLYSLLSIDSAFARQFWQTNGSRQSPSANGINRSWLRHPGRSPFNPSGLNKAEKCFGGTSDKQMWHVQSLTDTFWKIIPKRHISKQWVPSPFPSPTQSMWKGPGTRLAHIPTKPHPHRWTLLTRQACFLVLRSGLARATGRLGVVRLGVLCTPLANWGCSEAPRDTTLAQQLNQK